MEFIKEYPIENLKLWNDNPRINDGAAEQLSDFIEEYGFVNPLVIDQHGTIRAGHTRLKAAKKLGRETVPVIIYDFSNEAQAIGYAIADNKLHESSEWDFEKLGEVMKELEKMDYDLEMTAFTNEEIKEMFDGISEEDEDNPYVSAGKVPQYEIKGDEPDLSELIDEEKANDLIDEVMNAPIPEEIREFLIKGAYRHLVFDYGKVAEYYAHATPEVQRLMEKSAMVIIDIEDAIANGYVELGSTLELLKNKDDKHVE